MSSENRIVRICVWSVIAFLILLSVTSIASAADREPINWQRARELLQKQRRDEPLTETEKAYLERAKQQRRKGRQAQKPKETTGLTPLTEMTEGLYKAQSGGLYGDGKNHPPASHQQLAKKQLSQIRPLDAKGQPSKSGKIGLISLGMSNTTQEFSYFKKIADSDPNKSPHVVIVDCAQGGQAARNWAHPEKYTRKDRPTPWAVMDQRIEKAGLSAAQVQVAWIKQAQPGPAGLGEFPEHARVLQKDMAEILHKLKKRFGNLRVVYLSSRIYAGYASTPLNPEPYAYESAFSVRWLIEEQMKGKPELNCNPACGEVKSPLLLWGPYLWGDGLNARRTDGLVWKREDLAGDGTHPSPSGQRKVAEMLLNFFKSDPNARGWFLKSIH